LELIGSLNDIKREAREKELDSDQRKALRDEKAKPMLKQLEDWLNAQTIQVIA